MIVEYIRYLIPEDERTAFEASYGRAQTSLEKSPNCLSYEIARCQEESDRYVVRIEWDSMEGHLEGFRKSEEFRTFFQEVRPFVSMIEEMQHYHVVESGSNK